MKTYLKINTIWKRDENGVIREGDLSDEAVACVKDWIVTEKIDGTNIRVVIKKIRGHAYRRVVINKPNIKMLNFPEKNEAIYRLIMGKTDNANTPQFLLDAIDRQLPMEKLATVFDYLDNGNTVILFGEGYGPKIQGGGKYSKENGFILFDVWFSTSRGELWAERDAVKSIAASLDIPVVCEYCLGDTPGRILKTIESCVDGENHIYSALALDNGFKTEPEGFVCRPARVLLRQNGEPLMWKIKFRDLRNRKG